MQQPLMPRLRLTVWSLFVRVSHLPEVTAYPGISAHYPQPNLDDLAGEFRETNSMKPDVFTLIFTRLNSEPCSASALL